MKSFNLSVVSRETKGRHAVNRLRAQGIIPAVIYGRSGTRSLSVKDKDFRALLKAKGSGAVIVEVEDERREKTLATIAQIQKDAISDGMMHVDFKEISQDEPEFFAIPVAVRGEAVGVKSEDGVLEILKHEISIRCLLRDVVDAIEVDISNLHAGERIHVKNLPVLPGITYLGDPEVVVLSCSKQSEEEAAGTKGAAAAAEAAVSATSAG
ncbi:MAG: 50S ribosomal protein L25 [Puniceicoccales bacterium]|jgi:large subunit ribosomal protein L25|nr:50S ribosomal protein L25 [Puniceicoccales bacterium]